MTNNSLRGFTFDELNEAFSYDPETGMIFDKRRGKALSQSKKTYRKLVFKNSDIGKVQLYQHRLAWLLYHGTIDESLHIDHINGDTTDNRISNLRLVTRHQNLQNAKLRVDNTSGHVGVYETGNGNWAVKVSGKFFGTHKRKHQAIAVAKKMYEIMNFGPRHGQPVA